MHVFWFDRWYLAGCRCRRPTGGLLVLHGYVGAPDHDLGAVDHDDLAVVGAVMV